MVEVRTVTCSLIVQAIVQGTYFQSALSILQYETKCLSSFLKTLLWLSYNECCAKTCSLIFANYWRARQVQVVERLPAR